MGGCRCSYRTCNKASDGKTHFYHFPVRDEKRCEQWIVNSNRLDLKTISRAQLKNKVVCENHFPEYMFMNYKHERLVHNAVPNKEHSDEDIIEQSPELKNIDTQMPVSKIDLNNELSSTDMNTDVMSIDKELSTMTVNVSSVTGISFISPPEKKANSAPYIEILTRLHNNSMQSKKRPACQSIPKPPAKEISKTTKQVKNTSTPKFQKLQRFSKDALELNNSNLIVIPAIIEDIPIEFDANCNNNNFTKNNNLKKEIASKETSILTKPSQKATNPYPNNIHKNVDKQRENVNNISSSFENSRTFSTIQKERVSDVDNNTKEIQTLLKTIAERNNLVKKKVPEVIVIPPESNIENAVNSECGRSSEKENYTEFLDEGKKLLGELKAFFEKEKIVRKTERIRKNKRVARPLSKSNLYARIVPFLTPKTARIVHKELFPSMRHMHIS